MVNVEKWTDARYEADIVRAGRGYCAECAEVGVRVEARSPRRVVRRLAVAVSDELERRLQAGLADDAPLRVEIVGVVSSGRRFRGRFGALSREHWFDAIMQLLTR